MDEATLLLRERLADAAVVTDFDGTLSAIVDDPALARPAPGAADVLSDLCERARVVGVVSGRPVEFLRTHIPDPRPRLFGLYGLQHLAARTIVDDPVATEWAEPVARAEHELSSSLPTGALVEPKQLSLTVHFRGRPDLQAETWAQARRVAAEFGLVVRAARMSVELHPPGTPDKGVVVERLAAGCSTACFVGDDVGDLPAFDALDRLATRGCVPVRVGVVNDEPVPEILDRADLVLAGPAEVVAWLRSLMG